MRFGPTFYTLLLLVALIGSALGTPVDIDQNAGQTITEKRLSQADRRWRRYLRKALKGWKIDEDDLYQYGGYVVVNRGGQWYTIPPDWFPGGVYPTDLDDWPM
ncbi:hypothetical protein DFH28DRAFT_922212 [Melampsora americana]|nr:hypothetical protein DFH28DRAFT_922212 [Melampsora americana]